MKLIRKLCYLEDNMEHLRRRDTRPLMLVQNNYITNDNRQVHIAGQLAGGAPVPSFELFAEESGERDVHRLQRSPESLLEMLPSPEQTESGLPTVFGSHRG